MNHVIHTYAAYNNHHYGIPWAAPCDHTGRPNFEGITGHYSGRNGSAGDLYVTDPAEGSVWIWGQKCYRTHDSDPHYVLFRDGAFRDLPPEDLVIALDQAPAVIVPAPDKLARSKKSKKSAPAKKMITRHIYFTPDEDRTLRKRAAALTMQLTTYIKQQSLHGKVNGISFEDLTAHEAAIGEILHTIQEFTTRPHPDRWLYQADLEAIEDQLNAIRDIELQILHLLCKHIK